MTAARVCSGLHPLPTINEETQLNISDTTSETPTNHQRSSCTTCIESIRYLIRKFMNLR